MARRLTWTLPTPCAGSCTRGRVWEMAALPYGKRKHNNHVGLRGRMLESTGMSSASRSMTRHWRVRRYLDLEVWMSIGQERGTRQKIDELHPQKKKRTPNTCETYDLRPDTPFVRSPQTSDSEARSRDLSGLSDPIRCGRMRITRAPQPERSDGR